MKPTITFTEFEKVDIRIGTIIEAQPFPEARKPAYKLLIDFGPETGIKRSSAQITQNYPPEALVGKQIVAIINFPPKQIAKWLSEVLVLGVEDPKGHITLLLPDKPVENGKAVF